VRHTAKRVSQDKGAAHLEKPGRHAHRYFLGRGNGIFAKRAAVHGNVVFGHSPIARRQTRLIYSELYPSKPFLLRASQYEILYSMKSYWNHKNLSIFFRKTYRIFQVMPVFLSFRFGCIMVNGQDVGPGKNTSELFEPLEE